jgi:GntR family transcriptional regulator
MSRHLKRGDVEEPQVIDRESGIPYYYQLMEIVQQQIGAGLLQEGQQIPSELTMSAAYKVNRHTVRQAIAELCRAGVLFKVKGRGTFVANPPLNMVEYRLSPQNRFTDNVCQAGKTPGSKILRLEKIAAPAEVAAMLQLPAEEPVYALDILRLIDTRPFLMAKVYLPARHLPGFLDRIDGFHSLSAIYEQYGLSLQRVKSVIRASFPSPLEAATLDIPGNMPVLKVENVLKNQDNILIEYNVSCYRGDLAKISVHW